MNIKEFRLGNLVSVSRWSSCPEKGCFDAWIIGIPGTGCVTINIAYTPIEPITDDEKRSSGFLGNRNFDDIHPIPLTPEWLERLGFEKGHIQSGGYYGYSNGTLELDNKFHVILMDGRMEELTTREFSPPLKYVHQLQNLFFTLTGEELTVKEVTNG